MQYHAQSARKKKCVLRTIYAHPPSNCIRCSELKKILLPRSFCKMISKFDLRLRSGLYEGFESCPVFKLTVGNLGCPFARIDGEVDIIEQSGPQNYYFHVKWRAEVEPWEFTRNSRICLNTTTVEANNFSFDVSRETPFRGRVRPEDYTRVQPRTRRLIRRVTRRVLNGELRRLQEEERAEIIERNRRREEYEKHRQESDGDDDDDDDYEETE